MAWMKTLVVAGLAGACGMMAASPTVRANLPLPVLLPPPTLVRPQLLQTRRPPSTLFTAADMQTATVGAHALNTTPPPTPPPWTGPLTLDLGHWNATMGAVSGSLVVAGSQWVSSEIASFDSATAYLQYTGLTPGQYYAVKCSIQATGNVTIGWMGNPNPPPNFPPFLAWVNPTSYPLSGDAVVYTFQVPTNITTWPFVVQLSNSDGLSPDGALTVLGMPATSFTGCTLVSVTF